MIIFPVFSFFFFFNDTATTEIYTLSLHDALPISFGLVHFEFELLRDELRDALHHSLTCSLASHVDIAIICVTDKAMSTALQLSIEFIEYEVTQQRRKWAPLGSPFHAWTG